MAANSATANKEFGTTAVQAPASSSSSANTYLLVPILLLFVLLVIAVLRSPNLISSAGIGSAIIILTPLALATYALMSVAIAGRGTVDLSVGPLIGFINVTLVTFFENGAFDSPLAFFAYAIGVGVAYHLIMALIIIYVRVQPIIVALSGYLALSGINLVIMARPGGSAPDWMMPWGLGTSILSPTLAILVLTTAAWMIFARSAFFSHLKLMGADERSAYTAGVRISIVRMGAHVIAGIFSGLSAISFTALIGSGDPTQGTTYTLIAVTALVLGGTSLAGGRGGVIGSLLGALNIFLIGYVLSTFNFGAVQGFVTDLAYGIILVLSLLLTLALPWIQRKVRNVSPVLVFAILSMVFIGVTLHSTFDYSKPGQPSSVTAIADVSAVESVVSSNGGTDAAGNITLPSLDEPVVDVAAPTPSPTPAAKSAVATSGGTDAAGNITLGDPSSEAALSAATPAADSAADSAVEAAPPIESVAPTESELVSQQSAAVDSVDAQPATTVARAPLEAKDRELVNFVLENPEQLLAAQPSGLARPVTFAAIVLAALLALARVLAVQPGTGRMSPAAILVLVLSIMLALYWLATNMTIFNESPVPVSPAAVSPVGATQ